MKIQHGYDWDDLIEIVDKETTTLEMAEKGEKRTFCITLKMSRSVSDIIDQIIATSVDLQDFSVFLEDIGAMDDILDLLPDGVILDHSSGEFTDVPGALEKCYYHDMYYEEE
jgi:hypothetical protein